MTSARWIGGAIACVLALPWAGCSSCRAGQSIPCASDSHCASPLICVERVCQTRPPRPFDTAVCAATPTAQGCPCRGALPVPCFDGAASTDGVGTCRPGQRACEVGHWAACEAQVLPSPERCDLRDNDCNGETDEGVLNRCGTCSLTCNRTTVPEIELDPSRGSGVAYAPGGGLTLGNETIDAPYLWVANDGEQTVSKVDVATGREVGRYVSGPRQTVSNRPSRTSVDLLGDAYVVNRAFGGQGSITKFASSNSRCEDRDLSGAIRTSRDDDGNGFISEDEVLPWGSDECVLWNEPVGLFDAWPRAIAIGKGDSESPQGYVWVATFLHGAGVGDGTVVRLSAVTGERVGDVIDLPADYHPYGAVVDCRGLLWMHSGGNLLAIDTRTGVITTGPTSPTGRIDAAAGAGGCRGGYGITVDGTGKVWTAGNDCSDARRFSPGLEDPTAGHWDLIHLGGGRTIGVALDLRGRAWISHFASEAEGGGVLSVVDGTVTPLRLIERVPLIDTTTGVVAGSPMGVGVDSFGAIWTITHDNSCRTPAGQPTGCAIRHDPTRGSVELHPVGDTPYTYSDFLGFVARNYSARQGFYRHRFAVCETAVDLWGDLELQGDFPAGSLVRVRVRSAASDAQLDTATFSRFRPYEGPFNLTSLVSSIAGARPGRFVELEIELGFTDVPSDDPTDVCPMVGTPARITGISAFAECAVSVD